MPLIDYFTGKNVVDDTVINMVGGSNALMAGATKPTIKNGAFSFTGSITTVGDWSRIELPATFRHSASESWAVLIIKQYTSGASGTMQLFYVGNNAGSGGRLSMTLFNAPPPTPYGYVSGSVSGSTTQYVGVTTSQINRWHTAILGRAGSNVSDLILYSRTNRSTTAIVGNLFPSADCKQILGCQYNSTGYRYTTPERILACLHFNHKPSNAEIVQYNNALAGVI